MNESIATSAFSSAGVKVNTGAFALWLRLTKWQLQNQKSHRSLWTWSYRCRCIYRWACTCKRPWWRWSWPCRWMDQPRWQNRQCVTKHCKVIWVLFCIHGLPSNSVLTRRAVGRAKYSSKQTGVYAENLGVRGKVGSASGEISPSIYPK